MPSFDMAVRAKSLHAESAATASSLERPHPANSETSPTYENSTYRSRSRLVRSRRRRYLSRHPSYFAPASSELQLLEPLAYDRLVRQHQSAAEREAEGKTRGWASTLEASLVRGEAKLADVRQQQQAAETLSTSTSTEQTASNSNRLESQLDWSMPMESESPRDRARGRWHAMIVERFVQGRDAEFDYEMVDHDESLDADDGLEGSWRERRMQDAWFEEEAEGCWGHENENGRNLEGQTGVQDF